MIFSSEETSRKKIRTQSTLLSHFSTASPPLTLNNEQTNDEELVELLHCIEWVHPNTTLKSVNLIDAIPLPSARLGEWTRYPSIMCKLLWQPSLSSSTSSSSTYTSSSSTSPDVAAVAVASSAEISSQDDGNVSIRGPKVACFDLDGTLITTKSGKTFPMDENDWRLFDPSVPAKLKELHDQGYYVAIISNQGGLARAKSLAPFQSKIDKIVQCLGVPIDFVCSFHDDIYRKPRTAMWEYLARYHNIPLFVPNDEQSMRGNRHARYLYVGDAAGRPRDGTRDKDFSDTDLKFALNCGFEFQTPERFFLKSTKSLHRVPPPPGGCILGDQPKYALPENLYSTSCEYKEIVVLVAPPSCGKSTLSRKFEANGYHRVIQDELRVFDQYMQVVRESFSSSNPKYRRGIVVDNTSMRKDSRARWIGIARFLQVQIRCIVLQVPKEVCLALASFRTLDPASMQDENSKKAIDRITKFFRDPCYPKSDEGFDRIDLVKWSPEIPLDNRSQRLFYSYLV